MTATSSPRPTYAAVLRTPGMPRLVGAQLLARTAQQMASVALVLFTLERYGSAAMAGLVIFLSIMPGILVSPFAGTVLDRHRRIRLIGADYAMGALSLGLVVAFDRGGALPVWLLCGLVAVASLTGPLSNSGTRALFPMVVPRHLWDRTNALDSSGFVASTVIGPSLAGVIVGVAGAPAALLATAAVSALAAAVVIGVPEPVLARSAGRGILLDALDGIVYLVRSRSLRSLALSLSLFNLGFGIVTVCLPVLVLRRLGGGSGEVGLMFAMLGVGGLAGALVAGSFDSEGRERHHLGGGFVLSAAGFGLMAVGANVVLVALGMVVVGISNGPVDIGLFSLRQRRTHMAWVGRVFAVSMAFNFAGTPVGAALGGSVAERSPSAGFVAAAVLSIAAAAVAWWLIPARWESAPELG